jgi:hypothetical protein
VHGYPYVMASGGRVSPVVIGEPDADFDAARYSSPEQIAEKFNLPTLLELARLSLHAESEKVKLGALVAFQDRINGKPKTSLTISPGTPKGVALLDQARTWITHPTLAVHVLALAEAGAELEA